MSTGHTGTGLQEHAGTGLQNTQGQVYRTHRDRSTGHAGTQEHTGTGLQEHAGTGL